MARGNRPHITPIAGPILGEFMFGISVAMAGLWMASEISDAAAGAFGMAQQVMETLFVLFRVLAIGVFIRGRDMGSVVADMKRNVARDVQLQQLQSEVARLQGQLEEQQYELQRLKKEPADAQTLRELRKTANGH